MRRTAVVEMRLGSSDECGGAVNDLTRTKALSFIYTLQWTEKFGISIEQ